MKDNSDTPNVQHFILPSRLYLYNTYIVYIRPQTDFFGFILWPSALTFEFMKLWIYLYLENILNFSLQAFTFHEILRRQNAQTSPSRPLTLFSPTLAPWQLVAWDKAGQRTYTHANNNIYSITMYCPKKKSIAWSFFITLPCCVSWYFLTKESLSKIPVPSKNNIQCKSFFYMKRIFWCDQITVSRFCFFNSIWKLKIKIITFRNMSQIPLLSTRCSISIAKKQ